MGDRIDESSGITLIAGITMKLILGFQLYGGFYTLEYIRSDLITTRKWRIYASPYSPFMHGLSILIVCSLFSTLQGFIMVVLTHWFYDIAWGNLFLIVMVLLALSSFCQLVYLGIAFGVKKYKTAERLGTAFVLISMALAGLWFPIPEKYSFLSTYGNPLSLGQNAVYSIMTGQHTDIGLISFIILVLASGAMAIIAMLLGRRVLVI